MPKLSMTSLTAPASITDEMTTPTRGSSTDHPVTLITTPDSTTPSDIRESVAMCRKAPRVLMSPRLNLPRSRALIPLTSIPAAAVHEIAAPSTGEGCASLEALSTSIASTTAASSRAFTRDISTDTLRRP